MDFDNRIEDFRQAVERVATLQATLDTLTDGIVRRNELPDMIGQCGCGPLAAWLREELAASPHPLALRIRHSRLESELREVLAGVWTSMRTGLDAAAQFVTVAAGGTNAVTASPFVQRHLAELARYHSGPPHPATPKSRQAHLRAAWMAIDAAVAAVQEIEFNVRQRNSIRW
ncbi:MAG: hypothetical protein NTW21_29470 [Verrucomicrobia bacterium]|nr:hypothetical protein [Verrucomicrobiota bacterium]